MKNKILSYVLGGFLAVLLIFLGLGGNQVKAETCGGSDLPEGMYCCEDVPANLPCDGVVITGCAGGCCGIKLNTNFPIIGNCINIGSEGTNPINAFPTMMSALTKIAMSLVLVVCFITIIIAGVMRAGAGDDSSKATTAKGLIIKVAITILLLGFSGAILRLINPNFFG